MMQENDKKKHIDDFILFLGENEFDSGNVVRFIKHFRLVFIFKQIFGILLVIFGLTIIVIPLPHSLEIATIFYFDTNNGITISDLIALSIMLVGILFLLKDKVYYNSIIK